MLRFAILFCASMVLSQPAAEADMADAAGWFANGLRQDLSGEADVAFTLYRRAAEAGLPEAQFNVGVMLDSGRGVTADAAEAAVWYARAASHGNRRAAYNLGQLYEYGQGVPKNTDIARAWFAASGLGAGRAHMLNLLSRSVETETEIGAPDQLAPAPDAHFNSAVSGVEIVWTSKPQPRTVRFYVELRELDPCGSKELYAQFNDTSSVYVTLKSGSGTYAWRVLAVAAAPGSYKTSQWRFFDTASRAEN
jgi:hypothetical protein